MSTRALRKAQKLREQTDLESQHHDDVASEEEGGEEVDHAPIRGNKQSAFAMLGGDDDDDDGAQDEEHDEPDLSQNEYVKHNIDLPQNNHLM